MRRSNYTLVQDDSEKVVIRDLGPWDEYLSVTNDAEQVVEELAPTLLGRRLFYYDSAGQLDELIVKDGKFHSFAPGWTHLNPEEQ